VVLATPAIAERVGAALSASATRWVRESGYRILSLDSVRKQLAASARGDRASSVSGVVALLALRGPLQQEEARRLHFLATGKAAGIEETTWWDHRPRLLRPHPERPTREPVSLASSRLDGSIDARSAVSYLEWTMVLRNETSVRQAGQLEILLPRGAVISRASLWIAGTEREAAFGERGQVRQAYESVVVARRDPLLLTTLGADRISRSRPIEYGGLDSELGRSWSSGALLGSISHYLVRRSMPNANRGISCSDSSNRLYGRLSSASAKNQPSSGDPRGIPRCCQSQ